MTTPSAALSSLSFLAVSASPWQREQASHTDTRGDGSCLRNPDKKNHSVSLYLSFYGGIGIVLAAFVGPAFTTHWLVYKPSETVMQSTCWSDVWGGQPMLIYPKTFYVVFRAISPERTCLLYNPFIPGELESIVFTQKNYFWGGWQRHGCQVRVEWWSDR